MIVVLIILVLVLSLLFLTVFKNWRVSSRVPAQKDPHALHAIHWGLLQGGRQRAALAAFTQQLVDGTLVWNDVDRKYEVERVETDDPTLALIQAGAPFKQVLQSLEESLEPYERQLQHWGLWCEDQPFEKRARQIRAGWIMLSVGFMISSLWLIASHRTYPTVFPYVIIAIIQSKKKPPRQTREGQKLLKQFKRDHPFKIGETPESMLPTAVAIDGANALYDSPHAVLIWVLATQT